MDGVIYAGKDPLPYADSFISFIEEKGLPYIFLTNGSEKTPNQLSGRLNSLGLGVIPPEHFITSSMATARFLASQKPGASVYVIGGPGLVQEITKAGLLVTDTSPDYVVVGKTVNFHYIMLKKAVNHILHGAKFIGANPDVLDPVEDGFEPACGSLLAAVESASGMKPFIVGKPNTIMMTMATKKLSLRPEETLLIGDRMDTDIIGGIEAGMNTALVLTGVSKNEDISTYPYQPDYVFSSLQELTETLFR